jgi:hypothetical protein
MLQGKDPSLVALCEVHPLPLSTQVAEAALDVGEGAVQKHEPRLGRRIWRPRQPPRWRQVDLLVDQIDAAPFRPARAIGVLVGGRLVHHLDDLLYCLLRRWLEQHAWQQARDRASWEAALHCAHLVAAEPVERGHGVGHRRGQLHPVAAHGADRGTLTARRPGDQHVDIGSTATGRRRVGVLEEGAGPVECHCTGGVLDLDDVVVLAGERDRLAAATPASRDNGAPWLDAELPAVEIREVVIAGRRGSTHGEVAGHWRLPP